MRTSAPSQERSRAAQRLTELRISMMRRAQKCEGSSEEVREEGLRVYEALKTVRKRANKTLK
jgi:hypothetical protein